MRKNLSQISKHYQHDITSFYRNNWGQAAKNIKREIRSISYIIK